jgi:4'-phosphopantetheinyl transferase
LTDWSDPPRAPAADRAEIHLWLFRLDAGAGALARLSETLDEKERMRAARFRFPQDRDRFVAGRGVLRAVLGLYVGESPARIRLAAGPQGKPRLDGYAGAIDFNLSHSEDRAVLAVGAGRRIGVDIERVDPSRATEEIARRFFSPDEVAALARISRRGRGQAFFRCWTRKEAYLKALGDGLSLPLDSFSVSVDAVSRPRLLESDRGAGEVARWRLSDLRAARGFAGALAVEGSGWRARFWRYPPERLGAR